MARKGDKRASYAVGRGASARRAASATDTIDADALPRGAVRVDRAQLAPANSYGAPDFVTRGYYVDTPFRCVDCGTDEVWTAAQQQWWYEVAKGFIYSHAKRCRPCRQVRRVRRPGSAPT